MPDRSLISPRGRTRPGATSPSAIGAVLIACSALFGPLSARPAVAQAAGSLSVKAAVLSEAHLVGQVVQVQVDVIAGSEAPQVIPPPIQGAHVSRIVGNFPPQPISMSGIGDVVLERIRYRSAFLVVPERPGTLIIPPVTARSGGRSGASAPVRLTIRAVPTAGRPAAFLGGVGELRVGAEAEPTTLRAGQTIEYRIWLEGSAALGSTASPNLEAIGRLPLDASVETLPDRTTDVPPRREFRFRLRPTRPGEAVLPPVPIAYFDPGSRRYLTQATRSIPIRVIAVPSFEPERLEYGTRDEPGSDLASIPRWRIEARAALIAIAAAASLAILLVVGLRRFRDARSTDPARLALRLSRSLGEDRPIDRLAVAIRDGLGEYLSLAAGRSRGVLTPDEARREIARISGDEALAGLASELVAACDKALYSGRGASAEDLAERARRLFDRLGRMRMEAIGRGREGRGGEKTEGGTSNHES